MKKDEVKKVLDKIEIVKDWFDECTDREYGMLNNMKAQELIEKLEEIK